MNTDENNVMMAAFEAGRASEDVRRLDGLDLMLVNKDFKLEDRRKEALRERREGLAGPVNPAGELVLLTPESFALAVNDHKDARTMLYADQETGEVAALFDGIEKGGVDAKGELSEGMRSAGWGQFSASIVFRESRKLREWREMLEPKGQAAFAEFLEDHREDVVDPEGASLQELVQDLEATSTGSFKGRVNLDSGNVSLAYQDQTEMSVELPKEIVLGVPLFEHGERYRLKARLRYRVHGGAVTFRLLFTNLADAKEQEFERIVLGLEEKISEPIYRGKIALPWVE